MFQVVQLAFQELHYSRELRVQKSQNVVGELSRISSYRRETKRPLFTIPPIEIHKHFLFTYNFVILEPFIFNLDFQMR
jgi:hypothetical protein